jgi:hypothetical protein
VWIHALLFLTDSSQWNAKRDSTTTTTKKKKKKTVFTDASAVLRGRFNVDTPFVPTDASAAVVVVTVWEHVDDESQRGGRGVIIKKQ